MKKKILIQFGMNDRRLKYLIPACEKVGLEYDFFSYYNESHILDDFPEDFLENEYLAFVSIPVILYALKRDAKHYKKEEDFYKYNEHLIKAIDGDLLYRCEQEFIFNGMKDGSIPEIPLLNSGSEILKMEALKGRVFEDVMFMKPNSAYKEFLGGVTLPGEKFEDYLIRKKYCGKEVEVMLSPYHKIHSEYRFFVYDQIVATGSSYIVQEKYNEKYPIPEAVFEKAKEIAKLYQPSKCFTLDLCLLENGDIKIVEYNHFTASGNYNNDISKIYELFKADTQQKKLKFK